jgi:hypothetical protein
MTIEEELFARHAGKRILLDSNLLLVFISGAMGPGIFARFKRVSNYTIGDYELLVRLLGAFTVLVTTPHILTEVSNLANSLPEWYKQEWYQNFAGLVESEDRSPGIQEQWVPAAELAKMLEFSAFGITDAALTKLSSDALVVTEDRRLSGILRARNIPAINFMDLRSLQRLLK